MFEVGTVVCVDEPQHAQWGYEAYRAPVGAKGILSALQGGQYTLRAPGNKMFVMLESSKLTALLGKDAEDVMAEFRKGAIPSFNGGINAFTMGTDPEVFAVRGDGSLFPAWEFLPERKEALKSNMGLSDRDYMGAVEAFWDGFQAEFSCSSSSCHSWLMDYIRWGLNTIWLEARKKDPKATLVYSSVMDVPQEVMEGAEPRHVELGCMPSENLYGEKEHLKGLQSRHLPFRFAGCHIHIGTNKAYAARIVRAMDRVAGVASVAALRGMEDPRRRKFYGLAGEYRKPAHGVEWRTLSSAILAHPALTHLFFDLSRAAAKMAVDGLDFIWDSSDSETEQVINTYDVEGAEAILKRNKAVLKSLVGAFYGHGTNPQKNTLKIINEGAANLLETNNMEKMWRLGLPLTGRGSKSDAHWAVHSESPNCTMHALKLEE